MLAVIGERSRPADAAEGKLMEGRLYQSGAVAGAFDAVLPETLAEAERLATSVERAVMRETARGIRDLAVEVSDEGILLRGHCETFYCKQLAQHAAMALPGGDRLTNAIEVA